MIAVVQLVTSLTPFRPNSSGSARHNSAVSGAQDVVDARALVAPDQPGGGALPVGRLATTFERLFLSEYGTVVRIAERVLDDREEAEDVAQDVFLAYHRRHPADAPFAAAWLRAAAAHAALNALRSRKRRQRREELHAPAESDRVADPAQTAEVNERRTAVRRALGRLAAKPAAVLVLRYSGLSYAEVAAALGVGVGQVGTLLRRAEAALRREVERGSSR